MYDHDFDINEVKYSPEKAQSLETYFTGYKNAQKCHRLLTRIAKLVLFYNKRSRIALLRNAFGSPISKFGDKWIWSFTVDHFSNGNITLFAIATAHSIVWECQFDNYKIFQVAKANKLIIDLFTSVINLLNRTPSEALRKGFCKNDI